MTAPGTTAPSRADYGLDAPGVIRVMLVCGIVAIVLGIVADRFVFSISALRHVAIGPSLLWIGWALVVGAGLMTASSRWGKLRARDRLLDRLALTGSETVLDVGCGHGLLLIGAAKRLPRGRAIGVDLWSQVDQKSNSAAATMANARAEGVEDRVEVRDADMRALPLDDSSVDVVVSSLAIHNVTGDAERHKALREMVRVLRSGGRVGILDIAHVGDYAKEFRAAGMSKVELHGISPWIYPPARVLTAVK
ncbi:MAG TPA: class I SAM-dependent methyltransferase [Gemmatimonadaceae bacterium]|nr:class I SAM-dependent methyltransferase [Gemmatimonadaceae bacterium]